MNFKLERLIKSMAVQSGNFSAVWKSRAADVKLKPVTPLYQLASIDEVDTETNQKSNC